MAPFEVETDDVGSRPQRTMRNFRVRDLDAMRTQLRSTGAAGDARRRDTAVSRAAR